MHPKVGGVLVRACRGVLSGKLRHHLGGTPETLIQAGSAANGSACTKNRGRLPWGHTAFGCEDEQAKSRPWT